jgi:hypothetical protein
MRERSDSYVFVAATDASPWFEPLDHELASVAAKELADQRKPARLRQKPDPPASAAAISSKRPISIALSGLAIWPVVTLKQSFLFATLMTLV